MFILFFERDSFAFYDVGQSQDSNSGDLWGLFGHLIYHFKFLSETDTLKQKLI